MRAFLQIGGRNLEPTKWYPPLLQLLCTRATDVVAGRAYRAPAVFHASCVVCALRLPAPGQGAACPRQRPPTKPPRPRLAPRTPLASHCQPCCLCPRQFGKKKAAPAAAPAGAGGGRGGAAAPAGPSKLQLLFDSLKCACGKGMPLCMHTPGSRLLGPLIPGRSLGRAPELQTCSRSREAGVRSALVSCASGDTPSPSAAASCLPEARSTR
jgi:hypothetical protein